MSEMMIDIMMDIVDVVDAEPGQASSAVSSCCERQQPGKHLLLLATQQIRRFRRKTNEIAKFCISDAFTILEKIWTKIRSLDKILDEIGDFGRMKNNLLYRSVKMQSLTTNLLSFWHVNKLTNKRCNFVNLYSFCVPSYSSQRSTVRKAMFT